MLTIASTAVPQGAMLMIVSIGTPVHSAKDLGETVRRARREQRLTQIGLAERANVARGVVQKLESGRGTVNLPTVLKVLRTLSLDLVVSSRAIPIRPGHANRSLIPPSAGAPTAVPEW
jgi:transcriptional regulator with XRE-family HTH domain